MVISLIVDLSVTEATVRKVSLSQEKDVFDMTLSPMIFFKLTAIATG